MRTPSTPATLLRGVYCCLALPLVVPAAFAADAPRTSAGAADAAPIVPPVLEVALPGTIADTAVGGDGRFVLLWLQDVRKIAVFDVLARKIKNFIPIDGTNVAFAASADKLFVAVNDRAILQRWDIATGNRELTASLPNGQEIKQLAISQRMVGLLAASMTDKHVALIDPVTLATRPEKFQDGEIGQTGFSTFGIRAAESADEFVGWIDGSNYGRDIFDSSGSAAKAKTDWKTDRGGNYYVPSSDGRYIFSEGGIYNNDLSRIDIEVGASLPVYSDSGYFVGLRKLSGDKGPVTLSVYATADRRLLLNLPDAIPGQFLASSVPASGGMIYRNPFNAPPVLPLDKGVVFSGVGKAMILVPAAKDRLVVRPFDVVSALAASGIDYLFVTSLPPSQFTPGKPFTYQVAGVSRQGKIQYKLENGPAGMTLSPTGLLAWKPADDNASPDESVVISLKDASGQEIYHTFKVARSTPLPKTPVQTAAAGGTSKPGVANAPAPIDNGPDLTGEWSALSQDTTGAGKNLQATIVGTFAVQNRGKQASAPSKLRFYLATDDAAVIRVDSLYESDTVVYHERGIVLLQEVLVPALAPGGKFAATLNAPLTLGENDIGQIVLAEVNADQRAPELNKKNNIVKLQIK